MPNFDNEYYNIGHLDTLSYKQTFIHNIHPVIKLLVTLAFILFVISFSKYEIQGMIPFFMFPVFVISAGDIPIKVILKKIVAVSPFVLLVGIFNPVFDRETVYHVSGIPVAGGWISYASIIIKFILTISSALLLIATTSFPGICAALAGLRVPKIFVVQLLFLYRYIFVLAEETMRIIRARNMRTFGKKGKGIKSFISIVGVLLVRSIERSERIYQSIFSRGFDGRIRLLNSSSLRLNDIIFAVVTISFFTIFRTYDIAGFFGKLILTN